MVPANTSINPGHIRSCLIHKFQFFKLSTVVWMDVSMLKHGGHLFFQASVPEGSPELVAPKVGATLGGGGACLLSLQASHSLVWGQGALGQGGHPGVAHGPSGEACLQYLCHTHSLSRKVKERLHG